MIRRGFLYLARALDSSVVMPNQLHFGSASAVSYTPRGELLHWHGPVGDAIEDTRAAAAKALADYVAGTHKALNIQMDAALRDAVEQELKKRGGP